MIDIKALTAKVGGPRAAAILAGTAGAAGVWFLGRRKNAKSQSAKAQPVNVMAQGYADTAQDPTALYTGYDQLQREIDDLRHQPGAQNGNPVPVPPPAGGPGSSPPPAPVPPPPAPVVDISRYDGPPSVNGQTITNMGPDPVWRQPLPILLRGDGPTRLPSKGY